MKVRNYLDLLPGVPDSMGMVAGDSPIGAQGIALVKSFDKGYADKSLEKLPFAVQWKILDEVMKSEAFSLHKKKCKEILEEVTPETLIDGIKDILAGKRFRIRIDINGVMYGILPKPEDGITVAGITDETLSMGFTYSEGFHLAVSVIDTVGEDQTLLKEGKFKMLGDMDYSDYLMIIKTYNGIANKLYGMDWGESIKN